MNEAPEGEASLRLGEAAVMRNFRVTSGGALKKRPGSRDVAGLLMGYVPHVDTGSRRLLMTDLGLSPAYSMYPRMTADDVGNIECAGEPVTVDSASAGEYAGYFYERDGRCWRLSECVATPGTGSEDIVGGKAVPGQLGVICAGREVWTKDGGSAYEGERTLDTYAQGTVSSQGPGVRGNGTVRPAPEGTAVGWATQDVGGYVLRDGRLWRYYGARVDAWAPSYTWRKYTCDRNTRGYSYYTQGDWENASTIVMEEGTSVSGYDSYRFNSGSGTFTMVGGLVTIQAGSSGTIYKMMASDLYRYTVTAIPGSKRSTRSTSRRKVLGPYTEYTTDYSRGEYVGEVAVPDGARPEADKGYSYVTSFSYSGESYTVMRSGEDYFCYAKAADLGPASFERSWSFQGYPLTLSPDRYEWYFNETYSTASQVTDTAVRGLWSGFVGKREVLCAACGGYLWEMGLSDENGAWEKTACGELETDRDVTMFGFDEKLYILNGRKYLVWDGERLQEAEGYRPLVSVSVEPAGGGTLLESVNRLTAAKRAWFSPDGAAKTFQLPEKNLLSVDWVKDLTRPEAAATDDGPEDAGLSAMAALPAHTFDLAAGTVTFDSAPARGVNTLEIAWTGTESLREQVCAMRFAEIYNGAQDSRVFLYGDGTNRTFYSGLDHEGRPRADYFPDLYEAAVGDANTPVTAMIRHYNKLLAFKPDSAWSIGYDTITLVDGTVTAGFTVTPVNRAVGCCAWGQAQLVQNRPRTLDGRSVIEWRATSSGGITGDQRNAERVSQRVDRSIRRFDLTRARTFYDKYSHEYYVIGEDGTAIVQNLDVDAWYVYTGLDVTSMINYRDELYYGTRDGYLRHFSDGYFSDNGAAIDAVWESGAMSFAQDFRRKYSATVWVGIKPEDNGYLEVTAQTDRKSDFAVYDVQTRDAGAVPEMERIKLKAKKFTYYKMILRCDTADKTCTVVSADIRVRGTGFVR